MGRAGRIWRGHRIAVIVSVLGVVALVGGLVASAGTGASRQQVSQRGASEASSTSTTTSSTTAPTTSTTTVEGAQAPAAGPSADQPPASTAAPRSGGSSSHPAPPDEDPVMGNYTGTIPPPPEPDYTYVAPTSVTVVSASCPLNSSGNYDAHALIHISGGDHWLAEGTTSSTSTNDVIAQLNAIVPTSDQPVVITFDLVVVHELMTQTAHVMHFPAVHVTCG